MDIQQKDIEFAKADSIRQSVKKIIVVKVYSQKMIWTDIGFMSRPISQL